jgi:hypothetical protein
MSKGKMFSLRVPEKLLEDYRKFCDDNSITISKRLRRYMELDLEKDKVKRQKNITRK